MTPTYHPNVDETGSVCLPLISPEHWKPAIKIEQIIQALVALINTPEPVSCSVLIKRNNFVSILFLLKDHALRYDVAEGLCFLIARLFSVSFFYLRI